MQNLTHLTSTVPAYFLKVAAVLLLAAVSLFGSHLMASSSHNQMAPFGGCHNHGQSAPAPSRDAHTCCALGHSPALPTSGSPKLGSPDISLAVLVDQQPLRLGLLEPVATAASHSETPPAVSPLRI